MNSDSNYRCRSVQRLLFLLSDILCRADCVAPSTEITERRKLSEVKVSSVLEDHQMILVGFSNFRLMKKGAGAQGPTNGGSCLR